MKNFKIPIHRLITDLDNKTVEVIFYTKTGKVRTMECTRDLKRIPEDLRDGITDYRLNGPDIVAVFDWVNFAWRAFRKDAVISFEVIND